MLLRHTSSPAFIAVRAKAPTPAPAVFCSSILGEQHNWPRRRPKSASAKAHSSAGDSFKGASPLVEWLVLSSTASLWESTEKIRGSAVPDMILRVLALLAKNLGCSLLDLRMQ